MEKDKNDEGNEEISFPMWLVNSHITGKLLGGGEAKFW